jgi:hypothetical protein
LAYKQIFRRSNEFALKDKNLKQAALQIGLGGRRQFRSKNPRLHGKTRRAFFDPKFGSPEENRQTLDAVAVMKRIANTSNRNVQSEQKVKKS